MGSDRDLLVLGIDLGGTKILTAVVDAEGRMLSRDHSVTPAKEGQEAVVKSILESVGRAIGQAGIAERRTGNVLDTIRDRVASGSTSGVFDDLTPVFIE